MEAEERDRRRRNYAAMCALLVLLTDKDEDYWNCATYSELIAFAAEELEKERERIA